MINKSEKPAKPGSLKRAVGIGVAGGATTGAATIFWMHIEKSHGAIKWAPPIAAAARTAIWGLGIRPRGWAAMHRDHHEFSDQPNDPHSPSNLGKFGVAKLLARNYPMARDGVTKKLEENQLPPDLQPDIWDKRIFDKGRLGVAANIAGHMLVNKLVGNKARWGLVSFGVQVGMALSGQAAVNSLSHGGKHPWKALVTGEIEPHEDGSKAADVLPVALITFGEGNQKYHHEHPEEIVFAGGSLANKLIRDPFSVIVKGLTHTPLAEIGEGPAQISPDIPEVQLV